MKLFIGRDEEFTFSLFNDREQFNLKEQTEELEEEASRAYKYMKEISVEVSYGGGGNYPYVVQLQLVGKPKGFMGLLWINSTILRAILFGRILSQK